MEGNIVLNSLKERGKKRTPVDIMHEINILLAMMTCKVKDKNDPDWYLDHLEYDGEENEIYFICK
ncbi:MAG TPA: hypothetical protein DHV96_07950 [Lachnospiraceae bacterium]|nr:hypothetical protein [Lachnospiraceae bacterium]